RCVMSNVVKLGERCMVPVIDAQKRAKLCRRPAVTTREVEGVTLHFCQEHAAHIDAQRARVSSAERLDFTDAAAIAAWLSTLDSAARDVIAVAQDQTAPLRERDLGRRAAVAMLAEGAHSVESLIAFARAGLPAHVDAAP